MRKKDIDYDKLLDKSYSYVKRLMKKSRYKYQRLNDSMLTLIEFNINDKHNVIFNAIKEEINFYYNQYWILHAFLSAMTIYKQYPKKTRDYGIKIYIAGSQKMNRLYYHIG